MRRDRAYLVAEMIFRCDLSGYEERVWLTLMEFGTGSVVYIEPMTSGATGWCSSAIPARPELPRPRNMALTGNRINVNSGATPNPPCYR